MNKSGVNDDLTLWSTGEDVAPLERVMNRAEWANEKEISINSDTILFELFIMSAKQHDVNLKRKNQSLLRTNGATCLGTKVLNWIKQKKKKIVKRVYQVKMYSSEFTHSTFDYGVVSFITASGSTLSRLNITQNRALRLATGASFSVLTATVKLAYSTWLIAI
ncbi:hypothetical protein TNCT_19201 [Trichonephila clavata]|uniref:Uncharacterized protein n=1 Tax=Trichonephila clavata TaxID=2740835 RepID=A0A8X6G556_TRICU|nr:hypothetical protein TNCT_19201 [Trichonephila clavata]